MPTPEALTAQNESLQNLPEVQLALQAQAAYEARSLNPHQAVTVETQPPLAGAINEQVGVAQDLDGVVTAGNETFGIIRVHDTKAKEPYYLLSRFASDGGRATIVGIFDQDNPLTVGRGEENDLDMTVSRNHFSVGLQDGKLAVIDNGSTNGTELFQRRNVEAEQSVPQKPEHFAARSLSRLITRFGRRKENIPAQIPDDPLKHFETWAPKSAEVQRAHAEYIEEPASAAYQQVGDIVNESVIEQQAEQLRRQINDDPSLSKLQALHKEVSAATKAMYASTRAGNHQESAAYEQHIHEAEHQIKLFPEEDRKAYAAIVNKLKSVEDYRRLDITPESEQAKAIIGLISQAPKLQSIDYDAAPFKDYANNDEKAWKFVPDEEIRAYLSGRLFRDTNFVHRMTADSPGVKITATPDDPIDIPIDMIVDASGFKSWQGRQGPGSGKDVQGPYRSSYDRKLQSLDVIKHYASLTTELPPVSEINVFIQPDGKMFCDNGSGDSHRIAAAMLRGQKTVKTTEVTVRRIDRNVV